MNKELIVLGIESSCDETSAAILKGSTVLSNIIANQIIHEEYGGVVPELASRAHQQNIIPVVDVAIKSAKINKSDIDIIAYTKGPGYRIITCRKLFCKIIFFFTKQTSCIGKSHASSYTCSFY